MKRSSRARLPNMRRRPEFSRILLQAELLAAVSLAIAGAGALRAGDAPQPRAFSTGVYTLPQTPAPTVNGKRDAMMPKPSTASSVPPHYRTRLNSDTAREANADDPAMRFIVPLVERPVLAEARITIDGKPFRMLREERVEALAAELKKPAPQATPVADKKADDTAEVPSETPAAADDDSLLARLRRYSAAAQRQPSPNELRWLLANWAEGPVVLVLDENFERNRADQTPLFKTLDQDEDGVVSAREIADSAKTLLKYDRNQDESLSLDELARAADRTPVKVDNRSPKPPPFVALDDLAQTQILARLTEYYSGQDTPADWRRFDPNGDGRTDDAEQALLQSPPPEMRIDVAFDSHDQDQSHIEVTMLDASLGDGSPIVRSRSITFAVAGTLLELSAVQSTGAAGDQISLGAIRDGYPMLPEVDTNEDGRLTLREIRKTPERLATFDRDGDGAISAGELAPTLRVVIGRGATVHQLLARVRVLHSPEAAPTIVPPDWFVRMDRNKDGDVSRREFLGGRGQFDALDADGDELIDVEEATRNENTSLKDG